MIFPPCACEAPLEHPENPHLCGRCGGPMGAPHKPLKLAPDEPVTTVRALSPTEPTPTSSEDGDE